MMHCLAASFDGVPAQPVRLLVVASACDERAADLDIDYLTHRTTRVLADMLTDHSGVRLYVAI